MKPTTTKWKTEKKLKSKKTDMLRRSVGKQSVESVLKKTRKVRWVGFAEKEGFKPEMKE